MEEGEVSKDEHNARKFAPSAVFTNSSSPPFLRVARTVRANAYEEGVVRSFEDEAECRRQQKRLKFLQREVSRLAKSLFRQKDLPQYKRTKFDEEDITETERRLGRARQELQELEEKCFQESRQCSKRLKIMEESREPVLTTEAAANRNETLTTIPGSVASGQSQFLFPHISFEGLVARSGKKRTTLASACMSDSSSHSSCSSQRNATGHFHDDAHFQSDNCLEVYIDRLGHWLANLRQDDAKADASGRETVNAVSRYCKDKLPAVPIKDSFVAPRYLYNMLFPHQKDGVKFFLRLFVEQSGGLLGDEMGLGKTLTLLAFLTALRFSDMRECSSEPRLKNGMLIVAPVTVIPQWVQEARRAFAPFRCYTFINQCGSVAQKRTTGAASADPSGIMVISYEMLRLNVDWIEELTWSVCVFDEGQKIRNPAAAVTAAARRIKARSKFILSGSPIQNNLKELWSLFDVVIPGKLNTLPVFFEKFAEPIRKGGLVNATREDRLSAYHCAVALRAILKPHLLRRNKAAVRDIVKLPSKKEHILFCHLSPAQFRLYVEFLRAHEAKLKQLRDKAISSNALSGSLFLALSILRKICNHPDLLLLDGPELPDDFGSEARSGKLQACMSILETWKNSGSRALLFCQTVQMLNIIEKSVDRRGWSYTRLDGSTAIPRRQDIVAEFTNDRTIFLLLLTTRVGGVGLNLTAANRVLIFDPDWNPMTDAQARERSWRIGQTEDVLVYRLIVGGSLEEKIYHRQVYKHFLSIKILDDPRQKRFFKWNDVKEFFEAPPPPPELAHSDETICALSAECSTLFQNAFRRLYSKSFATTADMAVLNQKTQARGATEKAKLRETEDSVGSNVIMSELSSDRVDGTERIPRRQVKMTPEIRQTPLVAAPAIRCSDLNLEQEGKRRPGGASLIKTCDLLLRDGSDKEISNEIRATGNRNPLLNSLLDTDNLVLQGWFDHNMHEQCDPEFDAAARNALKVAEDAVETLHDSAACDAGRRGNSAINTMDILRRRNLP